MGRPNQTASRRKELLPALARTFAELGYRRATTAALAEGCGVAEPILYRLWPDKRAMFVAALDHVWAVSEEAWGRLASASSQESVAERILDYEARHHGEHGLYRIVFAGLSETDDPAIAEALRAIYGRFRRFIRDQVGAHRQADPGSSTARNKRRTARSAASELPAADLTAWALLGLGTVSSIGRELDLLSTSARTKLFRHVGRALLGPRGAPNATRPH